MQQKIDEIRLVVESGQNFFGQYFRAVILLFAANGVILKLFVDAGNGTLEKNSFFVFGALLNLGAVIGTCLIYPKYKLLRDRAKTLASEIQAEDVYFPGLIRTAKAFLVGIMVVLVSWCCLWFFQ